MKRLIALIPAAALTALMCASCAKVESSGINDANKRLLDSWLQIYHPEAQKAEQGIYILEDETGSGRATGDSEDYPYVYFTYTATDLDGNITETTDAKVAQQVGTYNRSSYYGPQAALRSGLYAGVEMMIASMKVGGTRKAVVPGWLATQYRYDTEEEYFEAVSGTDAIYTVTVHDVYSDINKVQIDSIERYIAHNFTEKADSTKYGYYYIQTQAPTDTTSFGETETVYINYTGQLLNGTVFDTTIKKTAKDAYIYSADTDYEPATITLAEDYTEIEMGSSTLIDAFSYCLSTMKTGEKGICIFYSGLGYGSTSTSAIPAYSPLRFDIEMIGTETE